MRADRVRVALAMSDLSREQLKRRAESSAVSFRGHRLGYWRNVGNTSAFATCLDCGASAHVCTNPPPNGIDISGSAVALNCTATATANPAER